MALGCGNTSGFIDPAKVARACDQLVDLCDSGPADECRKDLAFDPNDGIDRDTYDKFLDCTIASKTCGEVAGCFIGGVAIELEREVDHVKRGIDRMETEPLPPPCARFDELCSADETLKRRNCARMVRNLRSDPENLAKLEACMKQAKNCYAFDNCVDDLWHALN